MKSEVHNVDCMEFMRTIPDKFFSLAIADPPYGINAPNMNMGATKSYESTAKICKGRLNQGAGKLKNIALNTLPCDWDSMPPTKEFFEELERISVNRIIFGANYFEMPPTRCIVVWDKKQNWENFSQVEIAWTSFDMPAKIFRKGVSGGDVNKMRAYPKIHPTQKPVELYTYLLERFAKEGDTIFDPMMGSQSIRIACYIKKFDFVGCELDKRYFDDGNERFNEICNKVITTENPKQLNLFQEW